MSLMEYIPTQPQGADKYHGRVAKDYNKKREDSQKWTIEQSIIEKYLHGYPEGTIVLDVPCGTGRFFDFYSKNGYTIIGLDKSPDMLNEAADRCKKVNAKNVRLGVGDVRGLQFEDKSVDVAVMCRLTRWLSPEDCQKALRELQRVTKKRIILTARVRNHVHARSYALIEGALDGWKIALDEPGVDLDYRIIALEPTDAKTD